MKKTQVILALETSTNICSVALYNGNKIFEEVSEEKFSQSKKIIKMIDHVLKDAKLDITKINFIACSRGPGSFTGLRIGIGVAKGIAYGQNIPIMPISPLQAIAYRVMTSEKVKQVTVIKDARMNDLYVAKFKNKDNIPVLQGEEYLCAIKHIKLKNQFFAGTGITEYREQLLQSQAILSDVTFPYASDILLLSQQQKHELVTSENFYPTYIRNKVTY